MKKTAAKYNMDARWACVHKKKRRDQSVWSETSQIYDQELWIKPFEKCWTMGWGWCQMDETLHDEKGWWNKTERSYEEDSVGLYQWRYEVREVPRRCTVYA